MLTGLQHETLSPGKGERVQLENSLGKLVKFDGRRASRTAGKTGPADAQILLFTGVRYERGTPSLPGKTVDPRPKRKRG